MTYVDLDEVEVFLGKAGSSGSVIYVIDLPEHTFSCGVHASTIVRVPVHAWNESLTPWPAPGVRPDDEPFGGKAELTHKDLIQRVIPATEHASKLKPTHRAICGYSLGGLFSLWAFVQDSYFTACGCLSGSMWYEGLMPYLFDHTPEGSGRFAFFSIGKKECKAGPQVMRSVQKNMESCVALLREKGYRTEMVVGPGNHMQHYEERLSAGISAMDAFLSQTIA